MKVVVAPAGVDIVGRFPIAWPRAKPVVAAAALTSPSLRPESRPRRLSLCSAHLWMWA